MQEALIIDVRGKPCSERHELIFGSCAKLAPGEAFEIVVELDPRPIRFKLEDEQPGVFSWDYVEQGPEVWRIRIGRNEL